MLDGGFRFDNFVIGAANRLAASAARAVADAPGAAYNPLFIYSSSGLGKTHLLGAIGHHVRQHHPELAAQYLTLDDFVAQLHQAIATGQAESFKRRYAGVGLLLLDDVQFLTGRVETQSELLRVFNALQGSGRQIVMTCDRPPAEIADVDERLLSRLAGGLMVDVGAPDYETRVAILRSKCGDRGVAFSTGVLEELARSPAANVRELQGALNRLVAHQSLHDEPLGVADVWQVLGTVRAAATPSPDEFETFLSDLASTLAESVDTWRVRLGERIARWSGEGFRTDRLERELTRTNPPNLEALEAAFSTDAERLRVIEAEAVLLDPRCAGLAIFRDPDRIVEAEDFLARAVARTDPPPSPRPGYRLRDLVRTARNRMAIQAAAAVIEAPGVRYNPLFVHGPAGSGKSHLAHAVGNALRSRDGDDGGAALRVACVDAGQYVDELIDALQRGSIERWRARYRSADVLVVDNVQALDGKERTQDEFFHLFNVLHQSGRQMLLTCDRPLAELTGLQPRLRTRFEGGLVAEMGPVEQLEPWGRGTPVPEGAEAAAPTIDAVLDLALAPDPDSRRVDFDARSRAPQPIDSFFFDAEKVVAEWPGIDGRVVEELR